MPFIRRDQRALPYKKRRGPLVITRSPSQTSAGTRYGLNKISVGMFKKMPTLWPDRFLCKMRKVLSYSTGGPFLLVRHQTANCMYEPLRDIQIPAGYNEVRDMYRMYNVRAVRTTITVQNINTTNPLVCVHVKRGIGATAPDPASLAEMMGLTGNPYCVWGTLGIAGSDAEKLVLTQYTSIDKIIGRDTSKTLEFAVDTNEDGTGQPVKSVDAMTVMCNPNVASLRQDSYWWIEYEYYVEWFVRRDSADV